MIELNIVSKIFDVSAYESQQWIEIHAVCQDLNTSITSNIFLCCLFIAHFQIENSWSCYYIGANYN